MSAALSKIGEAVGSLERRRAFVQGCTAVTIKQVHTSSLLKMVWLLTQIHTGIPDHP